LIQLCGLPSQDGLDGLSLSQQLRDAKAPRQRPAVTTHNQNNHGVRSERWRYIRHADGSEELYDMRNDPNEWKNLVGSEDYADVIVQHRKWLPDTNAPAAPGSKHRILTLDNGTVTWEGTEIASDAPIPEL
jgi:hypothetical protein